MRINISLLLTFVILYILNEEVVGKKAEKRKSYYIENEKFLTWLEAFELCQTMNMTLFSVRNAEEFDFLKTIIKQRFGKIFPYWLGAYRFEGVYKWVPSGENIKRFMWHEGEPNDKSGHENCIHTWGEYFDWNDNDCERQLPFICETDGE